MATVYRAESACYYTECQQSCKRCSKAVEVEISSIEVFCLTSQFLANGGSPDTYLLQCMTAVSLHRCICRSLYMCSYRSCLLTDLYTQTVSLNAVLFFLPLATQSSPDTTVVLEVDSTPLGLWLLLTLFTSRLRMVENWEERVS